MWPHLSRALSSKFLPTSLYEEKKISLDWRPKVSLYAISPGVQPCSEIFNQCKTCKHHLTSDAWVTSAHISGTVSTHLVGYVILWGSCKVVLDFECVFAPFPSEACKWNIHFAAPTHKQLLTFLRSAVTCLGLQNSLKQKLINHLFYCATEKPLSPWPPTGYLQPHPISNGHTPMEENTFWGEKSHYVKQK